MKTKILVLASNPQGTDKLRLDKEIAEIEDILERSHKREEFELKAKLAVRVRDLQESIIKEKPRLVHFCGHGAGSEGLVLETESGQQQLVNNQALGDLFKLFDTKVECVMLNACYSQVQAEVINQHINYVIGTKKSIQDEAAISFTQGFYTALFNGEAIERAYEFGCNRIQLEIYGSSKRDRKLVPVYSEERGDLVELPQDEVLVLLKKEPLTQFEVETVDNERAESSAEKRDVQIKEGNYIENLEGNYSQNSSSVIQEILKNVSAGGNITVGDIKVIYNNADNLENIPKPKGYPQNIPQSNTEKFVGREKELESLYQQLGEKNQVTIAHVEGMGGIGKTELAIQYCLLHLQLKTYPGGICWLRAREENIGAQIVSFAQRKLNLKLPQKLEEEEKVDWCWTNWREGKTLVVIDDVTDYKKIKAYLPPQASEFNVLMTTRLKLKLPSPLYLKVLSEKESIELLGQLVGEEKVKREEETAKVLCKRLGYLPLAIQLVGQYVEEYEISLSEEIKRLKENGLEDSSIRVEEDDPTWTRDIKGVKVAFELSWKELSKSAQELGCLLSLFALAPIPWKLVERVAVGEQGEELRNGRVKLKRLNLLQGEDSYQLHQLIQEFFREKQSKLANTDEQKANFCKAIVEVAEEIPETVTLPEMISLEDVIPHLREVVNVYQKWLRDEDLVEPFIGLANYYRGQGNYREAIPEMEKCVAVVEERLGEENLDIALSKGYLALLYQSQGRYDLAEPLYVEALELDKRILGQEHPDVATDINRIC